MDELTKIKNELLWSALTQIRAAETAIDCVTEICEGFENLRSIQFKLCSDENLTLSKQLRELIKRLDDERVRIVREG